MLMPSSDMLTSQASDNLPSEGVEGLRLSIGCVGASSSSGHARTCFTSSGTTTSTSLAGTRRSHLPHPPPCHVTQCSPRIYNLGAYGAPNNPLESRVSSLSFWEILA
jgi:hypothetical protein